MSNLTDFHNKVTECLRRTSPDKPKRATQKELAREIGLAHEELSRRLNKVGEITSLDVKSIVRALVIMGRIQTKEEARYLLNCMDIHDFDPPDWNAFPLNQLRDAEPPSKLARSSGTSSNNQVSSDKVNTKYVPLTRKQKDTWQIVPQLIREYIIVHYRLVIGVLLALVVVIASSLAGLTILRSYIESKSLTRVDWNNFIYPGLCNPNQGEHVTVQNGTALDSGSLGRFFVQVYTPTTFGDLTGDGQPEAIVPYVCSDTDLNSPMKGIVYVHALIFSGYAAQPVVLGQFPALSGQIDRDFASVDYLYIDHEVLHLIGEGSSGVRSTTFDQQITLTYRWVGNQFKREHSQTDSIPSLLPQPGSNGQQLAYACPGMTDMEVQGISQDKKNATWGPNQVVNGGLTWEWWWVGPVRILWKDQTGKVHTDDHVSVPQQYATYIYHSTCI